MAHNNRPSLAISAILVASVLFAPLTVLAQDAKETARDAYIRGRNAFEAHDYQLASSELAKSWSLVRMPDTALWAAAANEKMGRLVEAAKLYREAISLVPDASWPKEDWKVQVQQTAQQEAKSRLSAMLPRIPTVSIEAVHASLAEFEVAIDGTKLSQESLGKGEELDPGNHTVIVMTKTGQAQKHRVVLAEGERRLLKFDLGPSVASARLPPNAPTKRTPSPDGVTIPPRGYVAPNQPAASHERGPFPIVGWVFAGVGAAGLLAGATAGAVAYAKYKQADCGSTHECDDSTYDRYVPSYDRWRIGSTVGFVAGGIGAATAGIIWLVTVRRQEVSKPLGVAFGRGFISINGAF